MSFKPTDEQQEILDHDFKSNPTLRVIALAGAGKTSTLKKLAEENANLRILYLAFGRDIRDEANATFPKANVECKTSHQLAWSFGSKYKDRLTGNLQMREVAAALSIDDWLVVKGTINTLTNFMASADKAINKRHLCKELLANAAKPNSKISKAKLGNTLFCARKLWEIMTDEESNFPVVHDAYLKLYQLSEPNLSRYDMIMFDEAQDANPVTTDILMRQKNIYRVLVGDPHQQIFRFRGAENAMDDPALENAKSLFLTGSFRFSDHVASAANAVLKVAKGEDRKVRGLSTKKDSIITEGEFDAFVASGNHKGQALALSRTGAGVLENALDAMAKGNSVYWIGTPQGYGVNDLKNLFYFKNGELDKVSNKKLLFDYIDYDEYKTVADAANDYEMNKLVRLLEKYGDSVPALLSRIRANSTNTRSNADLVVSSAHRSKGLEAKFVTLNDDWPDIADPETMTQMSRETLIDEMNLLYVAASRAKEGLVPNQSLNHLMREYIYQMRNPTECEGRLAMVDILQSEHAGYQKKETRPLQSTHKKQSAEMGF